MSVNPALPQLVSASSFLEYAFLRWVLEPVVTKKFSEVITPQYHETYLERNYYIDYAVIGSEKKIAIELDGFEYHGTRPAFTADRLRQNDLQILGWQVIRFSYDAIRTQTARCVFQLQEALRRDATLRKYLVPNPVIEVPQMETNPVFGLTLPPYKTPASYFETIRSKLNLTPLRQCQYDAFLAQANYYGAGGKKAACVMSVGAGKTVLGVVTCLAFTRKRAMIITPGNVIRGTFVKAFDTASSANALYMLPGGPLLPGCRPPKVLSIDQSEGPVRKISRSELQTSDIIITNFHSLSGGAEKATLLSKLEPNDIDLIVIDEAHIAAADSYQQALAHFKEAKILFMSACFQRLDGKRIEADVVYRYRLVESISEGNAKNLRVHRFAPQFEETIYEMNWPDGTREEIRGREALMELIGDERKLARITAKSDASIRQVMQAVKEALEQQTRSLYPVRPRVLFSALGELHAEQVARIAREYGIPCASLHYSMSEKRINNIRNRFEKDSGDLQGIVQLKMLGQGYDFPPITIVVPMRPYGSFSEFYQFIGRGIRILRHPGFNVETEQFLDIIYHAEMGLDEHINAIYQENELDPISDQLAIENADGDEASDQAQEDTGENPKNLLPETFVVFETGQIERHYIQDAQKVERRRDERELEALAQKYGSYVQTTTTPLNFDQYISVVRQLNG
jgi:superfamily II DNA or RNA helicase